MKNNSNLARQLFEFGTRGDEAYHASKRTPFQRYAGCRNEYIWIRDVDIIVKLDSKHLIDSLTSEKSVKYFTDLAQVFAKKAAETFLNEIKSKRHLFAKTKKRIIRPEPVKVDRVQNKFKPNQDHQFVLDEEEAFKLLEDPSPDGDNLDWHAPQDLTDEETDEAVIKKESIPIYGLKKVNGIYVRRFLGLLK